MDLRRIFIFLALSGFVILAGRLFFYSTEPASSPAGGPVADPGVIVTTGTVAANSSLSAALLNDGLTDPEIFQLSKSLNKVVSVRKIPAGANYEIHRSSSGAMVLFRYWTSRVAYADLRPETTGGFTIEAGKIPLESRQMGVQGTVANSLWESMSSQGMSPELIYRFADLFAWEIDFLTETQKGDTFRMVWERSGNDALQVEGKIFIAEYKGKSTGHRVAVRFNEDYYDLQGKSLQRQFLRAPLNYRRISSTFSRRRFQPVLRIYRPHHGIDYAAAHGTPVVSLGHGTVSFKGWHGGHGKTVQVRHGGAYATLYGHLSRYPRGIFVGKRVNQGEVIGYVGSTGLSTGPHLHFEFTVNGRPVNFYSLKLPAARGVSVADQAAFGERRKELLAYLAQAGYAQSGPVTLSAEPPEAR